jgi:hypothetical protein
VLCVTAQPRGSKLPTTEVVPPRGLWQFVAKRLLLVAVIALVMVWALSDSKKGTIAAVIFLAAIALIAAIQVPLLQRRWRRLEAGRLASLPADTVYAGPARAESPPGSGSGRPVPGEIILDATGLSFLAKRETPANSFSFKWHEMSHIRLSPISYAPLAGSLVLTLARGSTQSFVVQRCGSLADTLQHLPERL